MTPPRSLVASVFGASLVLGVAVMTRCNHAEVQRDTVVDSELLAFLSLARAHHHEANLLEQKGDTQGAVDALRKITTAPKPHPGQQLPEEEEVLADTYARIAELELENHDTPGARRDVEAGSSTPRAQATSEVTSSRCTASSRKRVRWRSSMRAVMVRPPRRGRTRSRSCVRPSTSRRPSSRGCSTRGCAHERIYASADAGRSDSA